jgi:hypothetical protein
MDRSEPSHPARSWPLRLLPWGLVAAVSVAAAFRGGIGLFGIAAVVFATGFALAFSWVEKNAERPRLTYYRVAFFAIALGASIGMPLVAAGAPPLMITLGLAFWAITSLLTLAGAAQFERR